MNMMTFQNKAFNALSKINYKVAFRILNKRRTINANNRVSNKKRIPLTKEEKKEFKTVWNRVYGRGWCDSADSTSHEFYKGCGMPFDAKYVPNDYYDFAEHVLNLRWSSFFLQHKCNLKYIIPERNRPKTILEKIDGHYVFGDNTEISLEEARNILKSKETFICKVALGSGGGRGVTKVCWAIETESENRLQELLKPEDLVFQEVVSQSNFMANFNPDSVNTFRLVTLNINEKCTVLSSFVRMGAKGSFVDNLCTGGGALVGVTQNGYLCDFGIRKDYSKCYEAPTGLSFKGMQVPNWNYIKEKVIGFHQHIPYANLIGWDITIDKDGEPIVIEINLDSVEIEAHQIFNGPFFGDRFDEVRLYIENKRPLLRHAMITY